MAFGQSLVWGVIGGVVGGIITLLFFFSAPFAHLIFTHLTVVNPLPKIARMADIVFGTGDNLIWGYIGHFIVSILYGLVFGLFMAIVKPRNWKINVLIGFCFVCLYTLIGPFLMMPLIMGQNQWIFYFNDIQFVVLELSIHLAFTLLLSLVFRLGMKWAPKSEKSS